MGLCFSVFFLRLGTIRDAGGAPICSRAMVFTASTAVNRFGFFFFADLAFLGAATGSSQAGQQPPVPARRMNVPHWSQRWFPRARWPQLPHS